MKKLYASPKLSAIGTINADTLQNKDFGTGDTFTFQNQPSCVDEGCEATSA